MPNEQQRVARGSPLMRPPVLVRITQWLFILNAVIWIVFGVIFLTDLSQGIHSGWIVGLLMFGNAAVLAGLGYGLGTRYRRWSCYLSLVFVALNLVLGVTDEVGLFDVLVMVLNAVMLVLLLMKRTWYTAKR
jgi:hypothetical protein